MNALYTPLLMSLQETSSSEIPWLARGATRMARGGIRLVHGLTKNTLITYFSGMKIDPKYAFLHAFFLICLSCSFQNLSIWPKTHPFFPILHVFAPLNDVRAYSAWSWKTTLITWIFGRAWYPPWHSSGPPGWLETLMQKDWNTQMSDQFTSLCNFWCPPRQCTRSSSISSIYKWHTGVHQVLNNSPLRGRLRAV